MEKPFPDPFPNNKNWAYLWINRLKFYIVFISWQVDDHRNILKQICRPLAFTSYKAFLKNKKRPGTGLSASFSAWFFWGRIFFFLIVWLSLFHEILSNMFIVIVCQPGCDVIYFRINLVFLIIPFLLHDRNVKTKI